MTRLAIAVVYGGVVADLESARNVIGVNWIRAPQVIFSFRIELICRSGGLALVAAGGARRIRRT